MNIKVDREERPDLDHIYQTAMQVLGRNGGWPLTVFLTPDLKPFFGGTYFPPEDRYGMRAFRRVLADVARAYREQRAQVDAAGRRNHRIPGRGRHGSGTGRDRPSAPLRGSDRSAALIRVRSGARGLRGRPEVPQQHGAGALASTDGECRPPRSRRALARLA